MAPTQTLNSAPGNPRQCGLDAEVKCVAAIADTPSETLVTVCIVSYNSGEYLRYAIEATLRQSETRWRLVIVDNGSRQALRPDIQDSQNIRLVQLEQNLGFAAANNLIGLRCKTPFFAALNPDAFPEPDWLEQLLAAAERHPEAAAFGSTQWRFGAPGVLDGTGDGYFFAGLPFRSGYGKRRSPPPEGEVFSACAAAALYRTDVFQFVGGFDESLFCYLEDVDLGFKFRLLGHSSIQASAAAVSHVGGGSNIGHAFSDRLSARNRIWVFFQNTPGFMLWVLAPLHLAANCLVALGHAIGSRFGTAFGLIEGLAGLCGRRDRRLSVQATRTASTLKILQALCWSPLAFITRESAVSRNRPRSKQ